MLLVQLLQKLDRYRLLMIDNISYMSRSKLDSSVLVEEIYDRYERKSLLVTSNEPLREWDENFTSGSITVAEVDRLVLHFHIIDMKGRATGRRQLLREFQVIRTTCQRH